MNSPFNTPLRADHLRFAYNGAIPQVVFANRISGNLNHVLSHKRKCFGRWGAITSAGRVVGAVGTQTIWRKHCHTGYGATHIAFLVGFLPDSTGNGVSQALEIDVDDGGGAVTYTITPGDRVGSAAGSPNEVTWRTIRAEVDPNTTYDIEVRKLNGARPMFFCAWEIAPTEIDDSIDFFHEMLPGFGEPIVDSFRQRMVQGYAGVWKRNASDLINFLGTKDGTSPQVSSSTWTNVIDGSTSVSSSTAGYYLGDASGLTLEQWCRLTDNKTLHLVIAAYGSMNTGVGDGEVRLVNGGGTLAILDGAEALTTTPGWTFKTTTISAIDTVSKVDLQFRAPAGNTLTLDAFSAFAYYA